MCGMRTMHLIAIIAQCNILMIDTNQRTVYCTVLYYTLIFIVVFCSMYLINYVFDPFICLFVINFVGNVIVGIIAVDLLCVFNMQLEVSETQTYNSRLIPIPVCISWILVHIPIPKDSFLYQLQSNQLSSKQWHTLKHPLNHGL